MKNITRVFLLLILPSLTTNAQTKSFKITSKNKDFSFHYNNEIWDIANEHILQKKKKMDEEVVNKKLSYTYYFYKQGSDFNSLPQFLVQELKTPVNFYSEMKKSFNAKGAQLIIENNKNILSNYMLSANFGQVYCNDISQTIAYTVKVIRNDSVEVTGLSYMLFSKNVIVQFNFSSESAFFTDNIIQFNEVINSFKWIKK